VRIIKRVSKVRNNTIDCPVRPIRAVNVMDLSKFKLTPKPKLSNKTQQEVESEPSTSQQTLVEKRQVKREHIRIEYDGEGPSAKNVKKNWVPDEWEQVLRNIKEMRKNFDAPVDTMGCDHCQDETATPEVRQVGQVRLNFDQILGLQVSSIAVIDVE
jgi:hypothetical protein